MYENVTMYCKMIIYFHKLNFIIKADLYLFIYGCDRKVFFGGGAGDRNIFWLLINMAFKRIISVQLLASFKIFELRSFLPFLLLNIAAQICQSCIEINEFMKLLSSQHEGLTARIKIINLIFLVAGK